MGSIHPKQLITAGLLCFLSIGAHAKETLYFSDVHTNHWSYECLETVVNNRGWMTGYQDHTFKGDWPVNRYAVAATLTKAIQALQGKYRFQIVGSERPQETGLPQSHWARSPVQLMVSEYQLMHLSPQGFMGNKQVSRQNLARILGQVLSAIESQNGAIKTMARRRSQKAIDLDTRSPNYVLVQKVVDEYHLMDIYKDHTFRPNDPVTRYELATVLCRLNGFAKGQMHT